MATELTMGVIDAANFVSSAVLISLGVVIIVATVLVINNLFSKYWRPVKVFTYIAAKISAEDAETMDSQRIEAVPAQPKKSTQPVIVK